MLQPKLHCGQLSQHHQFVTTAAALAIHRFPLPIQWNRSCVELWLQTDDAGKADHSAVLAGAPAINSRRFQELQESDTPNSVPNKLGCRCITYLDLGS